MYRTVRNREIFLIIEMSVLRGWPVLSFLVAFKYTCWASLLRGGESCCALCKAPILELGGGDVLSEDKPHSFLDQGIKYLKIIYFFS